jgi:hypothetical protein
MTSKGRSDWLKLLAMVTMFIDHCGVLLFPDADVLRMIGRLAFPIFAWGIARGFKYTRDRKKYMLLLFGFGAISQIPYMWLNSRASMDPYTINQLWQFLYSVVVLFAVEKAQKSERGWTKLFFAALALMLAFLPDAARYYYPQWTFSYGTYGILMSVLFYLFEGKWLQIVIGYFALSYFYGYSSIVFLSRQPDLSYFQSYLNVSQHLNTLKRYGSYFQMSGIFSQSLSILALPFIKAGEAEPKRPFLPRLVAYSFYPIHIALLLLIRFIAF